MKITDINDYSMLKVYAAEQYLKWREKGYPRSHRNQVEIWLPKVQYLQVVQSLFRALPPSSLYWTERTPTEHIRIYLYGVLHLLKPSPNPGEARYLYTFYESLFSDQPSLIDIKETQKEEMYG